MTITRADVESILIKRIGGLFTDLSLDGTTADGTNEDLNDPIAYALKRLGYGVTNIALVTDADLFPVSADDYLALFDLAELRCLQTALNKASIYTNITVGPRSEGLNQKAQAIAGMIKAKTDAIKDDYGIGLGTFTADYLTLDFARHGDDTVH